MKQRRIGRPLLSIAVAAATSVLVALPAAAQPHQRTTAPIVTAQIQNRTTHTQTLPNNPGNRAYTNRDCRCRYFGTYYGLGQVACIKTANGPRLARCSMMLNNTAWDFLSDGCPTVHMSPEPSPGQSRIAFFLPATD